MKIYATISADVVSSTSLDKRGMVSLNKRLSEYVQLYEKEGKHSWGRLVRGDGVECVLENIKDLLRYVLLLKFYLKSLNLPGRHKGVDARVAIAIGPLRTNDEKEGIIDGEAIYASGRALGEMSDAAVGRTMTIWCSIMDLRPALEAVISLVDFIVKSITMKQAEVLIYKLKGDIDSEIARKLNVSRANISTHLKRAGWDAIEAALIYFNKTFGDK